MLPLPIDVMPELNQYLFQYCLARLLPRYLFENHLARILFASKYSNRNARYDILTAETPYR